MILSVPIVIGFGHAVTFLLVLVLLAVCSRSMFGSRTFARFLNALVLPVLVIVVVVLLTGMGLLSREVISPKLGVWNLSIYWITGAVFSLAYLYFDCR